MKSVIAGLLLGGWSLSVSVHAGSLSIQPDRWELLSVPGESNRTVHDLFASELGMADYGTSWTIYVHDGQRSEYRQPSVSEELQAGRAFWMIHTSSDAVGLNFQLDAPTVPLSQHSVCASPFGCFEFPLPTGDLELWSLLGTPFPEGTAIADLLLVTGAGPCTNGCTLKQAREAALLSNTLFEFNSEQNAYETLGDEDFLEAGEGYWISTNVPGHYAPARLIIPTFCTPYS